MARSDRSGTAGRGFLKADNWRKLVASVTDQQKGLPPPPMQEPPPDGARLVDLVPLERISVGDITVADAIFGRRSRRRYTPEPLSLEEVSFLLLATQGVSGPSGKLRTVPSAGARHPFESYVAANRVNGLEPGLYRYLPLDHKLCFLRTDAQLALKLAEAANHQEFVADAAVVFIWAAVPYRTEWRYGVVSPKLVALDAGHVCQNLYLACEAIGAGCCGIAAYDQKKMDAVLELDGKDEFAVYCAPAGKIGRGE